MGNIPVKYIDSDWGAGFVDERPPKILNGVVVFLLFLGAAVVGVWIALLFITSFMVSAVKPTEYGLEHYIPSSLSVGNGDRTSIKQSDGGDTDVQPAAGYLALDWELVK